MKVRKKLLVPDKNWDGKVSGPVVVQLKRMEKVVGPV